MVRDADIEQFPDRFGSLDDLVRKLPGNRNVDLTLNRAQQRTFKAIARHIPTVIHPTGDGQRIITELREAHEQATEYDKVATGIVLDNTIVIGDNVFPTASFHYRTFWTRDAQLMVGYTESPTYKRKIVEELGTWQRDDQIPTEICLNFLPPFTPLKVYRPDESNLIWLIMALESGYKNWEQIARADRYVARHVEKGRYISPAGNRRSNIDALDFPGNEKGECTIGYVNLLHAYEKILAVEAGLSDKYDAEEAAELCRKMAEGTNGKYFPLSDTLQWVDAGSTFFGEYLATVHGQPILGKEIVKRTLEKSEEFQMEEQKLGLVTETGTRVPAELFIRGDKYQEPEWPFWRNVFDGVCELNDLNDGSYRARILRILTDTNWREYPEGPAEKDRHGWNAYILKMFRDVEAYKLGRSVI